jgi:hypothetical protein
MVAIKHISARSEISEGEPYVLVTYGEKYGKEDEVRAHVITVPHGASMAMSELSFTAAVHAAKEVAKHEKIPVVYACK